jgi:O-acetyl-ADP-ribose deacetylase (regulator of RNase III)
MNRVKILQADITKIEVDAIVNAANTSLLGGGGVDGAIHRAAGKELLEECRKLNGCETGKAKITKGYNLPAKFIIHTVGPVYRDGKQGEPGLLSSCYRESLALAVECGIKTIAFPCISTGVYGYPFREACTVALQAIEDFLQEDQSISQVIMVCFGDDDFKHFSRILNDFT